jgi:hypothetical protein
VSLFADTDHVVGSSKRSPLNIYKDFMIAFKSSLGYLAGLTYSLTAVAIPLVTLQIKRKIQSQLSDSSNEKAQHAKTN